MNVTYPFCLSYKEALKLDEVKTIRNHPFEFEKKDDSITLTIDNFHIVYYADNCIFIQDTKIPKHLYNAAKIFTNSHETVFTLKTNFNNLLLNVSVLLNFELIKRTEKDNTGYFYPKHCKFICPNPYTLIRYLSLFVPQESPNKTSFHVEFSGGIRYLANYLDKNYDFKKMCEVLSKLDKDFKQNIFDKERTINEIRVQLFKTGTIDPLIELQNIYNNPEVTYKLFSNE